MEWEIKAVEKSPGTGYQNLVIDLRDIPIDANTGNEVADITIIDNSVDVKSEERAKVSWNIASITSPAGAVDHTLSTKQEFTVQADINFNGTVATASRQAEIVLPFGYAVKSGENKIFDLSAVGIAHWTVIAPETDRTGDQIVVIARGTDRNSGVQVTLNSDPINIIVVERTDLRLTLSIVKSGGSPGDTLSVGQKFSLQAVVNNVGTAEAVGGGKLYIEGLEDNNIIGFSELPQEDTLSFTIGEPVGWDLEVLQLPDSGLEIQPEIIRLLEELKKADAKNDAIEKSTAGSNTRQRELFNQISYSVMALETQGVDLTVNMSQIPEDENTNKTAFTEDSSVVKTTYIQPVAKITFQKNPEHPGTVSTGQIFDFIVTANLDNNLVNPQAHVLLPVSFEISNGNASVLDLPLEEGSDQAVFKITVPSTDDYTGEAVDSLSVYLTGEDSNTGEPVMPSATITRTINIQRKPEIYMASEIVSPIAARESNSLSHGQTITIDAWPVLRERSDKPLNYAPIVGDGSIEIDNKIFSLYKFEAVEGEVYKKTFSALDQKLRFILRAPRENKTALIDIKFADLPKDSNSGTPVTVNPDSGSVSLRIMIRQPFPGVTASIFCSHLISQMPAFRIH